MQDACGPRCLCKAGPMVATDDVTFVHRLADAADAVSREHIGSEALTDGDMTGVGLLAECGVGEKFE